MKNHMQKRNVFQPLASDYVVKEVFNDELEKDKVYI
jgi:hypothetical protein